MRKLLYTVALTWSIGAIFAEAFDWHGKQPTDFIARTAAIGIIAGLVAIATRPEPSPADPLRVPVPRGVQLPPGELPYPPGVAGARQMPKPGTTCDI